MSGLYIFSRVVITLSICVSLSLCRPQDSSAAKNDSVKNITEASVTEATKEIYNTNITETTITTTPGTKLSTITTQLPKVSPEVPTTTTSAKPTLTTAKPQITTQGTTKATEAPKIPSVLTKTPLRAEKPSKDLPGNKTDDLKDLKENENVKSLVPGRQKDIGVIPGVGDFADVDEEEENPTFRLKEPGFGTPKPRPVATTPATTDEDKRIRKEWGGNCLAQHWLHCSKIQTWGDGYIIYDKSDREKLNPIKMNKKLDCNHKDEKDICLRNGWTVKRCHIICMSQCNRDMYVSWDRYVSHEGACALWKK